MDVTILDEIPFELEEQALLGLLRIRPGSKPAGRLGAMLAAARRVARPREACKVSAVQPIDRDTVAVDGVRLSSRLVSVNLAGCERVFPYLATCGRELEQWSAGLENQLEIFWADAIKLMALGNAHAAIEAHIRRHFEVQTLASMNPGSLADWPLSQQRVLFGLLGEAPRIIGIDLSEACLMMPLKSASGLHFESDDGFVNCRLCAREGCSGRRAPYDAHLLAERFGGCGPSPAACSHAEGPLPPGDGDRS